MTYKEATEYLFNMAPLFQHIGAGAYKEGLSNTLALDEHFGHPHKAYKTIHVAGTNGKGSCSHTLAAILQSAGYKVGLYTSPHLMDFRERIRVNGKMIPEERVTDFVEKEQHFFEPLYPSFFELATALAFLYFKEQQVDFAVIEVGLGGRLDCTNIISPILSVITNISFDHTQFLGQTLPEIAAEKAGIIKPGIPIVIGETNGNAEVKKVFQKKIQDTEIDQTEGSGVLAKDTATRFTFADETEEIISFQQTRSGITYQTRHFGTIDGQLGGICQEKNTATILQAIRMLQANGIDLTQRHVKEGFANVCSLTGLMGRWQQTAEKPLTICDTGHNAGGIRYISQQIKNHTQFRRAHMVIGMVGDKDVKSCLSLFPKDAIYYFTQASVKRAMPYQEIQKLGKEQGLEGSCYASVAEAYEAARQAADENDLVFIGGSSFVVADYLTYIS